jgi:hypothetical protein
MPIKPQVAHADPAGESFSFTACFRFPPVRSSTLLICCIRNGSIGAKDCGVLKGLFEFAYISGPQIAQKRIHRFRGQLKSCRL